MTDDAAPQFGANTLLCLGARDGERGALSELLGLLRAGERSAAVAFRRMTRRLKPAGAAHAQRALEMIVADELRHDDWLAAASDETRIPAIPVTEPSRRFFSSLESHDLVVHLSRIATLDGCVCQILSRVLAADGGSDVPAPIAAALIRIRRDEAGHVRTARALARELGLDSAASRAIELETRRAFSGVIARHESAFTMLGVDAADLARRLQRHET